MQNILNLTRNNSLILTSFHGRSAVSLPWSFNFKPHSIPMKCYTTHQNIRAVSGVTGEVACLLQTDVCVPDYRKGYRYFATSSIPSASKVPWYEKIFLGKFASRTYHESKFIDFNEESHGDYYVPVILYNEVLDRAIVAERRATKAEEQLETLHSLIYCNAYRKEVIRIETLFQSADFFKRFRSINIICEEMLIFFNEERKNNGLNEVIVSSEMKLNDVFKTLTRKEKWTVIIAWFFYKQTIELESSEELLRKLKDNYDIFIVDFEELKTSAQYEIVERLKEEFLKQFLRGRLPNIDSVLAEFSDLARSIHVAFQRCSKELRRMENITSSEATLVHIRKKIMDDDQSVEFHLSNKLLDIIVKLSQM